MQGECLRWYQGREEQDAMAEFFRSSRISGVLGMVTKEAIAQMKHELSELICIGI